MWETVYLPGWGDRPCPMINCHHSAEITHGDVRRFTFEVPSRCATMLHWRRPVVLSPLRVSDSVLLLRIENTSDEPRRKDSRKPP